MNEQLSQQILGSEVCTQRICNKQQAKAFFRFLWTDLHINFTADDDFLTFGLFTDEAAELLNSRMEDCFGLFGPQTYDLLLQVMGE